MAEYIAAQRLLWGDGHIEAGEPVPSDEPGRNYALAEQLGQIEPVGDSAGEQQAPRRRRRKASAP